MNTVAPESDSKAAPAWRVFLHRWLIHFIAMMVAGGMVSGIHYHRKRDLFLAALLLGIAQAIVRPILVIISLPLVILTFGLFVLVINAGLLIGISAILKPNFEVTSFSSAFWGALVISITSLILGTITGLKSNKGSWTAKRSSPKRRPPPVDSGPGSGPIIDI